ncbi:MAG: DUF1080 domain-containing protein [Verrucomicrobia bacterium]|nr:DUF1080 domain-containing protein [Verrucomicrobiota bacterium]
MKLHPALAPFLFSAAVAVATAATPAPKKKAADPTPELPPASATAVYEPVPVVVSAPPSAAPSDAVVLFDGKNLDAWITTKPDGGPAPWKLEGDAMVCVPKSGNIRTRQAFGDIQLHLEFRTPAVVSGEGQGRGNSGVFFMGIYELQILDSYNNPTYVNGQAGSIYKQYAPLVNASRPPGEWQSYDVVWVAPRFGPDGKVTRPARMTVFHNGVLVQHDAVLKGNTPNRGYPAYKAHADRLPLSLQDHNNTIAFRNIWVRELKLPAE